MALAFSIFFGVVAYELHKAKKHGFAIFFDVLAVLLILISWSV